MYKLWHFLFGWDYIYWQNSVANGIARVHKTPDGQPYYYRYKLTKLIDIIPSPSVKQPWYNKPVMWLTCSPSKYFPEIK